MTTENIVTCSVGKETTLNTVMMATQFWSLPDRIRDTVEDVLLFHKECVVWYENDGFHMTWPGCSMQPEYTSDYVSVGKINLDLLPEMWACRVRPNTTEDVVMATPSVF